MIFGNPDTFALESIIEPGPEFPPFFGNSIAGRVRLFFGGRAVGNFDEPCCVLRPLSQHLVALCSSATALWHESLAQRSPQSRFKLLNEALFIGDTSCPPSVYDRLSFLTNVSEALNSVKGFLVAPPGEPLHALLQLHASPQVHCYTITVAEFCSVSTQFAFWLNERENELLQPEA